MIEERRIDVHELELGMYVARLDRPWVETPFPIQGVLLQADAQVELLRRLCREVWIDVARSIDRDPARPAEPPRPTHPPRIRSRPGIWPSQRVEHVDTVRVEDEAPQADQVREQVARFAARVVDDVRAGRKFSAEELSAAVTPVVRSVLRSAEALFWINALRKRDSYAYSHSINCSTLAAALGRHLGFPEDALVELAAGGLMLDVGKAVLPESLLSQPSPLDLGQRRQMREHVAHGLRILDEAGIRGEMTRDMVRTHHERYDGTGYPAGLSESAIPLAGRIGAVIDAFDAMTSERPFRRAVSRHDALQELYRGSDTLYQREIVEQLTQCLGVYPTGTLVELNTGEVAIVMAQNRARSLRPRLIVLTDRNKQLDPAFRRLDLMDQPEHQRIDGLVYIVRTLEAGAYGLDPTELYL